MKGIIVLIIIVMIAMCQQGCSKPVLKMEADTAKFMADNTLSTDCKAGIAAAAILAPDTDAAVRIAAEAVGKYANKESDDYKICYSKTAFVSFAVRGGIDEVGKIAASIVSLGIIK